MTQDQSTRTNEDEFYDDVEDVFPAKEDLKDRLVAVWALENGTDTNDDGKTYPTVKTITLVLDDGPDGYQHKVIRDGEQSANRVPSVELDGPSELDLRWSTVGMVSRFGPRVGKTTKPALGRINSRANKTKGRSASWSIAAPTEADRAIARQHSGVIAEITERLTKAQDANAFDE